LIDRILRHKKQWTDHFCNNFQKAKHADANSKGNVILPFIELYKMKNITIYKKKALIYLMSIQKERHQEITLIATQ